MRPIPVSAIRRSSVMKNCARRHAATGQSRYPELRRIAARRRRRMECFEGSRCILGLAGKSHVFSALRAG
jgi:hypothetical protein